MFSRSLTHNLLFVQCELIQKKNSIDCIVNADEMQ